MRESLAANGAVSCMAHVLLDATSTFALAVLAWFPCSVTISAPFFGFFACFLGGAILTFLFSSSSFSVCSVCLFVVVGEVCGSLLEELGVVGPSIVEVGDVDPGIVAVEDVDPPIIVVRPLTSRTSSVSIDALRDARRARQIALSSSPSGLPESHTGAACRSGLRR